MINIIQQKWSLFTALKPVAWVLGNWQIAAGVAGAAVLVIGAAYMVGRDHGGDAARADYAAAQARANRVDDESEGIAAEEREADTRTISQAEKDRNDAIDQTPGGDERPSAVSRSADCERLRRQGTDVSRVPGCGGRSPGT